MIGKNKKIILILGATASGKSSLALKLKKDKKIKIINVDSRQCYKGLEVFSGIIKEEKKNILVSFLNPENEFSAGEFVKLVNKKIDEIFKKDNEIILVGGTAFYFEALIYENFLPQVSINKKLREKLNKKDKKELFKILEKKDMLRSKNIDKNNKIRIIRSLEIINAIGSVPKSNKILREDFEIEIFWIDREKEEQKKRIERNFKKRAGAGLLEEASRLKNYFEELGWDEEKVRKKFCKIGLAYKHIFDFWDKKISKEDFLRKSILEEQKYSKRQNTYIRKFFKELPLNVKKKII